MYADGFSGSDRATESEFRRRPCRSGDYEKATTQKRRVDHHSAVAIPSIVFGVDHCGWHAVPVYVRVVGRPHVSTRTDNGESVIVSDSCRSVKFFCRQTFTAFVFLDLVSAVQSRGLGCGLTQNRMLVLTVSVSFLAQIALVYVPFMQAVFQTEALELRDLLIILGLAGTSMVLHEIRRTFERKVNAGDTYTSVMEEMA